MDGLTLIVEKLIFFKTKLNKSNDQMLYNKISMKNELRGIYNFFMKEGRAIN